MQNHQVLQSSLCRWWALFNWLAQLHTCIVHMPLLPNVITRKQTYLPVLLAREVRTCLVHLKPFQGAVGHQLRLSVQQSLEEHHAWALN